MAKPTKAELTAEAEALGIDVDGRWGIETLQEKIDAAKAARGQEGQDDAFQASETQGEGGAGADAASGDGGSQTADAGGQVSDGAVVADQLSAAPVAVAPAVGSTDGLEPVDQSDGSDADALSVEADADNAEGQGDEGGTTIEGEKGDQPLRTEEATETTAAGSAPGASLDTNDPAAGLAPANSELAGEAPAAATSDGLSVAGPTSAAGGDPVNDRADAGAGGGTGGGLGETAEDGAETSAETIEPTRSIAETAENPDYEAARDAMTWPMLAAFQAASSVRGIARGQQTGGFALDMDWMPGDDVVDKIITLVRHAVPFARTWPDAPAEALYGHVASGGGVNLVLDVAWAHLDLADQAAWTVFRDTLVTLDRFLKAADLKERPVDDRPTFAVSADDLTLEPTDEPFAASRFGEGGQ